jgi:hypothetical protein
MTLIFGCVYLSLEDFMKKMLSILIVLFVTSLLSGCIISYSPKDDSVIFTFCGNFYLLKNQFLLTY